MGLIRGSLLDVVEMPMISGLALTLLPSDGPRRLLVMLNFKIQSDSCVYQKTSFSLFHCPDLGDKSSCRSWWRAALNLSAQVLQQRKYYMK